MKPTAMALGEFGTWPNSLPATVRMGGRRIALNPKTNLWDDLSLSLWLPRQTRPAECRTIPRDVIY